ncbi:MAG: sulfite exporter TauE/SafE family protein [Deltaproteobacteria bacterium]|nr:sulfite exporter TauE/SafE family protein [Deltaproteobacteria bacterium]
MMHEQLISLLVSLFAGFIGSIIGVGGGIIIVPFLTLFLGVDIHHAVSASLISIIATSSAASPGYIRRNLVNLRVANLLEAASVTGAVMGAVIGLLAGSLLVLSLYAGLLLFVSVSMAFKRTGGNEIGRDDGAFSKALGLDSSYRDEALGAEVAYSVHGIGYAIPASFVSGILSTILGIGGGIFNVPLMTRVMRMPIKAGSATSAFMIGITAAAGSSVFLARGMIDPRIAAPVAIGVLAGALAGNRIMNRISGNAIRYIFSGVAFILFIRVLARLLGD